MKHVGNGSDAHDLRLPVAVLAVLLVLFLALASGGRTDSFVSSEVRFAENVSEGLSVVPASCESSPHAGDICNPQPPYAQASYLPGSYSQASYTPAYSQGSYAPVCSAGFFCIGRDLYYTSTSCANSFQRSCGYQCGTGGCVVPPPAEFEAFDATYRGGTFRSDGSLRAIPTLLRSGDTAQVYWRARNVASCTVTGTNGDSWTASSSGEAGRTSSPITQRTTFTRVCQALPEAAVSTIGGTAVVNVVPSFDEQ